MQTAKLQRVGLWVALLATLYLVFQVSDTRREDAAGISEPVRQQPREMIEAAAQAPAPAVLRRQWREEAQGDPFQTMHWYVAPKPERERPPPPQAPPLPFVYFGKMTEDELPYAFLQKGNKVLVVKAGDMLDGLYRVESVSPDSVMLVYLPLNVRQSVAFGAKNRPVDTAAGQVPDLRALMKAEPAEKEEKAEKEQDE